MREGEEEREEEWWSWAGGIAAVSALFPTRSTLFIDDSCIWGIFAGGLFLILLIDADFLRQGGSQVWVKERLWSWRGGDLGDF